MPRLLVLIKVRFNVKDTLKDLFKSVGGWTNLYRRETCHGTNRSPPFWFPSLCRVKTSGIVETLMPPSHHSFLSSSYPSPDDFFLLFYSVSHSRARRLTYLAADRSGGRVSFSANVVCLRTVTLFSLLFAHRRRLLSRFLVTFRLYRANISP